MTSSTPRSGNFDAIRRTPCFVSSCQRDTFLSEGYVCFMSILSFPTAALTRLRSLRGLLQVLSERACVSSQLKVASGVYFLSLRLPRSGSKLSCKEFNIDKDNSGRSERFGGWSVALSGGIFKFQPPGNRPQDTYEINHNLSRRAEHEKRSQSSRRAALPSDALRDHVSL